jgi:hypothetical protein
MGHETNDLKTTDFETSVVFFGVVFRVPYGPALNTNFYIFAIYLKIDLPKNPIFSSHIYNIFRRCALHESARLYVIHTLES